MLTFADSQSIAIKSSNTTRLIWTPSSVPGEPARASEATRGPAHPHAPAPRGPSAPPGSPGLPEGLWDDAECQGRPVAGTGRTLPAAA